MAEVLGIVAGYFTVEHIVKFIPEPVKIMMSCICCFDKNVQNLKVETRNLEVERSSLQMIVDTEENNAGVVDALVQNWLEKVSEIQREVAEIDSEITTTQNGGFTDIFRYSLTKKVKEAAKIVQELRQSCNFNPVSHPPAPPAMVSIPLESTFDFESRKDIEEEIIVSLRNDEINMLGICGMGGVGKTTMAKRIVQRVREGNLFEEIVMVGVGQKTDMLEIQGDIANSLGLEFKDDKSLSSRAHDLRVRLGGKKRSLIILDDVWQKLNLVELGILCNGECKILLTSRDSDIFKIMCVEKVHAVSVLSETEAWDLFKSKVGSCIEQENVVSVARQVINQCKCLPIALVTVGAALKDMENTSVWEDWLHQLKSSNPIDLPQVLDDVYRPLRLSYEFLKSEGEKFLFLFCCLYPEDYNVPLEELAIYGMGLGMFKGITSLEQARNRVCTLVERLKSCFLLLESWRENHVKMHDIVRDVARFIAKDEKRIQCNECTWICSSSDRDGLHHVGSNFPNLQLLLINDDTWDNLSFSFEGVRGLRVCSWSSRTLLKLPQTTRLLTHLHTLILYSCVNLSNISVVGELVNLEIFICRGCESIVSLPAELGRRLRLLEVTNCTNLKTIPRGMISNQERLEELTMVGSFDGWEAESNERGKGKGKGKGKGNAAVSELQHLSKLTHLQIQIRDFTIAEEEILLPPNMMKYAITIGGPRLKRFNNSDHIEKKLELLFPGTSITLANWVHECFRSVESMWLEGNDSRSFDFRLAQNLRQLTFKKCGWVTQLVNMTSSGTVFPLLERLWLIELDDLQVICDIDGPMSSDSFKNLKDLRLRELPALKHLWRSHGPYQNNVVSIFNHLSSIHIRRCYKLLNLFALSTTAGDCLLQLENLEIWECYMMEQVFWWDEEEQQPNTHITKFPKLKFLSLYYLPKLTSFCEGTQSIEFPLLAKMSIKECPLLLKSFFSTNSSSGSTDDHADNGSIHTFCKVEFPSLKELAIGEHDYILGNWCRKIRVDFFARLVELEVSGFKGMDRLFSYSIAKHLLNIKYLRIKRCKEMVEVIEACSGGSEITPVHIFPNLEEVNLNHLHKLKSFCECALELPKLKYLNIVDCHLMHKLSLEPLSVPNLETISIDGKSFSHSETYIHEVNNVLQQHQRSEAVTSEIKRCGVGFIANLDNKASHEIVTDALTALGCVDYCGCGRCGVNDDSVDGSGVMTSIPWDLFNNWASEQGIGPFDQLDTGVGMIFLPNSEDLVKQAQAEILKIFEQQGLQVLGWRSVPVDVSMVGCSGRETMPNIQQVFVQISKEEKIDIEREFYICRDVIEKAARSGTWGNGVYFCSLSNQTIVYKGMLRSEVLGQFYYDLQNNLYKSPFVIYHRRHSRDTSAGWPLAQPMRFLGHNGEINSIRENSELMQFLKTLLESPIWNGRGSELRPLGNPQASYSADIDSVAELSIRKGDAPEEAMMRALSEAYKNHPTLMSNYPEYVDLYDYCTVEMEAWDGPALLLFSDGKTVGSCRDRIGLRPARYWRTVDNVVYVASTVDVLPDDSKVVMKGYLAPGMMITVDLPRGQVFEVTEVKKRIALSNPSRKSVKENICSLKAENFFSATVMDNETILRHQQAYGYSSEEVQKVIESMASQGKDPTFCMGDDIPLAVQSERPHMLFDYFKQQFPQVTNPAIDPLREGLVMYLKVNLGKQGGILEVGPENTSQVILSSPVLNEREIETLSKHPYLKPRVLHTFFDIRSGVEGSLEKTLHKLCKDADDAVRNGSQLLILSDRSDDLEATRPAIPILLAVGAVHQYLIVKELRMQTSIVADTAQCFSTHHFACLIGYGTSAVCPYLALETCRQWRLSNGQMPTITIEQAQNNFCEAVRSGLLKILSKLGIPSLSSYCDADRFEVSELARDVIDIAFGSSHVSNIGGLTLDELARESLSSWVKAFSQGGGGGGGGSRNNHEERVKSSSFGNNPETSKSKLHHKRVQILLH